MLLAVANVCTVKIMADSFVAVTCVNHHYIGVLHKQLGDNTVHVEALTAAAGPETEEIGIVSHLYLTFLTGYIDGHGYALTVCIKNIEIRHIRMHLMLFIHQT